MSLPPLSLDEQAAALESELADEAALAHARLLERVLRLHQASGQLGRGEFTDVTLALLLRCTERRAELLLRTAQRLAALDAGFTVFQTWTAEQTDAVLEEIDGLSPELADTVVAAVLARGRQVGSRPVRRATQRERLQVEAADAAARRKKATAQRHISHTPMADGQAGLWITGPAVDILAIMSAVKAHSHRHGPADDRSADNRRFDALVQLVTGHANGHPSVSDARPAPGHPAVPVVHVLTPMATALGRSDAPGELIGHGPVDADWIRELLHQGVIVQAVPVDPVTGQPLGPPSPPVTPGLDPHRVRQALLDMATTTPPARSLLPDCPSGLSPGPGPAPDHQADHPPDHPPDHPADHPPGPYRPPAAMARYLDTRAPYCEFPGCTVPATHCDHDHDIAWPQGPTCPCNLGPLSRHHHRVKQTGWTKTRHPDGQLTWTSPTGRRYDISAFHDAPPLPDRPLPALPVTHDDDDGPFDDWDPRELDDPGLQAYLDRTPDDTDPTDPDPDRQGRLAHQQWQDPWHDHTWGRHLDDPHLVLPWPELADAADPTGYDLVAD